MVFVCIIAETKRKFKSRGVYFAQFPPRREEKAPLPVKALLKICRQLPSAALLGIVPGWKQEARRGPPRYLAPPPLPCKTAAAPLFFSVKTPY